MQNENIPTNTISEFNVHVIIINIYVPCSKRCYWATKPICLSKQLEGHEDLYVYKGLLNPPTRLSGASQIRSIGFKSRKHTVHHIYTSRTIRTGCDLTLSSSKTKMKRPPIAHLDKDEQLNRRCNFLIAGY
ncbi:hypothetical protein TNCT_640461 [Trichonephila clavata]|uniref:Uncharacterized protein n=1 Tax=Trichonephila clavata TaxID=2740835 RepID=A0A8X6K9C7_TRICU|nr:hypothetical protein TNCT_640461 [Trichonephila clavata]